MFPAIRNWACTILGAAITPLAMLIGLASAGAGHGDYVWARIVYPLPILGMFLGGISMLGEVLFSVGLLQWIIYGALIDVARRHQNGPVAMTFVLLGHVLLSVFTFVTRRL